VLARELRPGDTTDLVGYEPNTVIGSITSTEGASSPPCSTEQRSGGPPEEADVWLSATSHVVRWQRRATLVESPSSLNWHFTTL
jgi:hypothetical protein